MSIPSSLPPSSPSNNNPAVPASPATPNAQDIPLSTGSTTWQDPTGAWVKFLSKSGTPPTREQVNMFFRNLLKFFSAIIQEGEKAHKRSMDELKKAVSGDS